MKLSHRARMHLQYDSIVMPKNLIDFTASDSWKQIIEKCKRPASITDPNNAGQTIAHEDFQFPAQSLISLKVAEFPVEYYYKTSRPLDAESMVWDQRLKNFQVEIISLLERNKGNYDASLLIISNKLIITNFFEAYNIFAVDYIGQNNCPINCLLRKDSVVGPSTTIDPDKPYSSTHGLVEDEIIQRFSDSQPFYKTDNDNVSAQLVISMLGSQYAYMIAPFKIANNGHEEINALKS